MSDTIKLRHILALMPHASKCERFLLVAVAPMLNLNAIVKNKAGICSSGFRKRRNLVEGFCGDRYVKSVLRLNQVNVRVKTRMPFQTETLVATGNETIDFLISEGDHCMTMELAIEVTDQVNTSFLGSGVALHPHPDSEFSLHSSCESKYGG